MLYILIDRAAGIHKRQVDALAISSKEFLGAASVNITAINLKEILENVLAQFVRQSDQVRPLSDGIRVARHGVERTLGSYPAGRKMTREGEDQDSEDSVDTFDVNQLVDIKVECSS